MNKHFEELKQTGQLPSPSSVGMRILELTGQEDWSVEDLARTMQADPALCGRILRVANSVASGGSSPCTTVDEATVRLGATTVRNVALGFTLISGNRTGVCRAFDYEKFWSDSLHNAIAAQEICRITKLIHPAEAFTCTLLARVGELALASVHPQAYAEILEKVRGDPGIDPITLEVEAFGMDRDEVGMDLVADWGLPERFSAAIGQHRRKQQTQSGPGEAIDMVQVLRVARAVAEYHRAEHEVQRESGPLLDKLRGKLGLSVDEFLSLCTGIQEQRKGWGALLDIAVDELAPPPGAPERTGGEGMLVLAVDDDALSLTILTRQLVHCGHRVIGARNGKEGLALALSKNPQIVITDWSMPEMDGIELVRTLRRYRTGQAMHVIVLTGHDEEEQIVRAFDAGVDDYLTKPFRPRILAARLKAGVRVIRLQQQVEEERRLQFERSAKLSVMARKLQEATLTDPLTQIPNRRYAMRRLSEEWAAAKRSERPLSVILVDIDHFKRINDAYGHVAGDKVLIETARLMQQVTRQGETCSRIGGEEFLVICPEAGREGALQCAERLRLAVEDNVVEIEGRPVNVTVSLGVAELEPGMPDTDALLKVGDQAVYEAKRSGRNRVEAGTWRRELARPA